MKVYVVTEGDIDIEVLRRLIPEEFADTTVFAAAGSATGTKSLARSLVVRRAAPVVVIIDSDSLAHEVIIERKQSIEETVGSVAGDIPIKAILAVPELESIFFHDLDLLPRITGTPLPSDVKLLSEAQPKRALNMYLTNYTTLNTYKDLLPLLSESDVLILRDADPVRELLAFLDFVANYSSQLLNAA